MRRSIATVCLSGTLEEKLAAAAAAGFDGVELFEPDLIASPLAPGRGARPRRGARPGDRPLPAVPRLRGGARGRFAANLRRAEAQVRGHGGSSAPTCCSSARTSRRTRSTTTRSPPRSCARSPSAPPSAASGSPTRRSPGAATSATTTTRGGSSRRPTTRTSAPAWTRFHILSRGADPAGIRDIPAEKIFFLQLADAPQLVMDVLQWSRHYRCFPGQGGFDLAGFLGHVLAAGYDGPLSLEVFNDVFRQADPRRMAVDAMRSLLLLEDDARRRAARRCAATRSSSWRSAPERPPSLERLLIAMGFRHAGQHRTKPVQLWRHGDTRVLVNHERAERRPAGRRDRGRERRPDPLRRARRGAARAAACPRDRAPGRGRPHGGRRARRHVGVLLPHRRRLAGSPTS